MDIKNRFSGELILSVPDRKRLSRADLRWADLSGADLSGADLGGADLSGADLSGADLRWANLGGADLGGADLSGADLTWANLSEADLSEADLSGNAIPVIDRIDVRLMKIINANADAIEMGCYHTCETTHCRAGWAIVLGGEPGKQLEHMVGSNAAGALIYAVSRPGQRVPDLYATNEDARCDIEMCAARQG